MAAVQVQYPKQTHPQAEFTQQTLNRLTSHILSWKQGPGNYGGLHLHSCWGNTGVLQDRYHGQTISSSYWLMLGAQKLYEQTKEDRWRRLTEEIISNILFLQAPNGGFIHARSEYEPGYTTAHSCPIHQSLPLLALLEYVRWQHTEEKYRAEIKLTIDRHWEFMKKFFWKNGNSYQKRPLSFPGWCGVVNQDLTMIAALARYAQLFGDDGRFAEYGQPSLDYYLSDAYYFPQIGLMERGDRENFVERTCYYDIIIAMLSIINEHLKDDAIEAVRSNLTDHLYDSLFIGEDGLTHFSWGAETAADERSRILGWIRHPITLSGYPGLIRIMREHLQRNPDAIKAQHVEQLEYTLASYVFADGTFPGALETEVDLFPIVTSPTSGLLQFWIFLMEHLGAELQSPEIAPLPVIHRVKGELSWKTNDQYWSIEENGTRLFAGWKINPHGIIHGTAEELKEANLQELAQPEVIERLDRPL